MLEVQIGQMVKVRNDIDPDACPVSRVTAGLVGLIEDVRTDEDGDTAALLWFGERVPRLHNDGCWLYLENLEVHIPAN